MDGKAWQESHVTHVALHIGKTIIAGDAAWWSGFGMTTAELLSVS